MKGDCPWEDFKKLIPHKRLFKTGVEFQTYTGEIIRPKGFTFVQCDYKGQRFESKINVINQKVFPICGCELMSSIGLT